MFGSIAAGVDNLPSLISIIPAVWFWTYLVVVKETAYSENSKFISFFITTNRSLWFRVSNYAGIIKIIVG